MDIPLFWWYWRLEMDFKINHFFNFYNTQEEKIISIAAFYLEGPALN